MAFDKGHALLVGVAEYGVTPGLSLRRRQTVKDAEGVQQVLTDPKFCGYPAAQVQLLTDKDATRDGFLAALDTLAQQATEDSTVVVFYSGHGEFGTDGETYYLTTHETALTPDASGKNRVVDGSALRQDELLQKLKNIKAKRLLVIFNACHSGAFSPTEVLSGTAEVLGDEAEVRGENLPPETTAAILGSGAGRIVITACRGPQFSFVGSGERTLFADTLVKALQGEGWVRPNNNYIGVFDMYNYLFEEVKSSALVIAKRLTPQQLARYANGVQEPEITVIGGVGPFPVALYKGRNPATLGELGEEDALDEETAPVQISPKTAERMFRKFSVAVTTTTTTTAGGDINTVGGDQTTIGGNQTTIGGDSAGGNIDKSTTTIGGDWVGGDKFTGDKVAGDKVFGNKTGGDSISVGNISGSSGVAIGRGASANVTHGAGSGAAAGGPTLQQVAAQAEALAAQMAASNPFLGEDLQSVALQIKRALRVDGPQRVEHVARVKEELGRLIEQHPGQRALVDLLGALNNAG